MPDNVGDLVGDANYTLDELLSKFLMPPETAAAALTLESGRQQATTLIPQIRFRRSRGRPSRKGSIAAGTQAIEVVQESYESERTAAIRKELEAALSAEHEAIAEYEKHHQHSMLLADAYIQLLSLDKLRSAKKRRGRPPGAKNKPKE